jgi:hypothetical protein
MDRLWNKEKASEREYDECFWSMTKARSRPLAVSNRRMLSQTSASDKAIDEISI